VASGARLTTILRQFAFCNGFVLPLLSATAFRIPFTRNRPVDFARQLSALPRGNQGRHVGMIHEPK
jgi:hypothetical protein